VGWEKVACWSTKVAISLKRVKIGKKLLRRASRKLATLFRTVPSTTPYGLFFPSLGFATPSQNSNRYYLRNMYKATDIKFGRYIYNVHPNKSPLKVWRKESVGVFKDCPKFVSIPYYFRNG